MNPWIETFIAVLGAALGVLFGWVFSKLRRPYWTIGYFIPLAVIVLFAVARRIPTMTMVPPVSWMMMGRIKFAVFAFITTMILVTPLSRVPQKRVRSLVCILMAIVIWASCVWPVLSPVFNRAELQQLKTKVDGDGICLQSNDYTCGAAAAVTGLRRLGFPAEEGDIAILAHTSTAAGTEPDVLADELQKHYGKDGLIAEYRTFRSVNELKGAGITLAVVKYGFLVDHFVTVLEATDSEIVIGDPLNGRATLTHDAFAKRWRFVGVVLRRQP